ncbi:MAG TPA: hypothetical protein DCS07_02745 [Bdellovibrionales bacterium]|nr:MAG: hypothetical protein A2070_00595 [Bdellovibrionales bacterium GWC1_52_8]HAR41542.1 hypothetical protein [Bdellovibrionales bacterium]
MSKALLLISTVPEDRAFSEQVASTAGLTLKITPRVDDAIQIIANEEPAIIFVDTSTEAQYLELHNKIQNSVGLFSNKVRCNSIHFLSNQNIEETKFLIQSPLFGNYVMRNFIDPRVGEHYGHLVAGSLSERPFGLAQLMKPGTKIQKVVVKQSEQKQDAVEAVRSFMVAAKFQSRMATVVANAVDELLMNAIFDAPVDAMGRQMFANLPRNAHIDLIDRSAVEMQVAYDGFYVGVTAIDLFGSLDKLKLLSHMSKIYTQEEYKVRSSGAGAGIGLATVFRSGGSFFFASEAGSRTEVTVFFRKTDSFREFKDQFRFISTQFFF